MFSELSLMFAAMIARCAKDIDVLIESLPSEESSTELQVGHITARIWAQMRTLKLRW